jgi:hypothetical protein
LFEQRRTPTSLNLLLEQNGTNSGLTMAVSY